MSSNDPRINGGIFQYQGRVNEVVEKLKWCLDQCNVMFKSLHAGSFARHHGIFKNQFPNAACSTVAFLNLLMISSCGSDYITACAGVKELHAFITRWFPYALWRCPTEEYKRRDVKRSYDDVVKECDNQRKRIKRLEERLLLLDDANNTQLIEWGDNIVTNIIKYTEHGGPLPLSNVVTTFNGLQTPASNNASIDFHPVPGVQLSFNEMSPQTTMVNNNVPLVTPLNVIVEDVDEEMEEEEEAGDEDEMEDVYEEIQGPLLITNTSVDQEIVVSTTSSPSNSNRVLTAATPVAASNAPSNRVQSGSSSTNSNEHTSTITIRSNIGNLKKQFEVIRTNRLPVKIRKRVYRRKVGEELMENTLKVFGKHWKKLSFESTKRRDKNAINDFVGGVLDYVHSALETSKKFTKMAGLEFELPIVQKFVDAVRNTHFTPAKLSRLIDGSMRHNISSMGDLRGMLNFYVDENLTTWNQVARNVRKRGGKKSKRLNMMCSGKALTEHRRLLEAAGITLFGGNITDDKVGANIDVDKFIELYLRRLYASLDKERDIENGIVKSKVLVDVTNDGTNYASCSINIAGLKIFPYGYADLEKPQDKILCVPLSVFVASDNTTNLVKYHSHLYDWFQTKVPSDGKVDILLEDGKKVTFIVDYAFSCDMKAQSLLCGYSGMGGTNNANVYYCCPDVQKETQMIANGDQCHVCLSANSQEPCRHTQCISVQFEFPECFKEFQPILNVYRELVLASRKTKLDNNSCSQIVNKYDTTCLQGNGLISIIDYSCADSSSVKAVANRLSEFTETFSNIKNAKDYISKVTIEGKTMKRLMFEKDLQFERNDLFVNVNDAKLEDLQHYLRVRVCRSRLEILQFKEQSQYLLLNQSMISVLQDKYQFVLSDDIVNDPDVTSQSRKLVKMWMRVEQYILYSIRDQSRKIVLNSLVKDRLRFVICDLHMEMRIGLKLLEDLFNNCIFGRFKTTTDANTVMSAIEEWINSEVFRNASADKGTYQFPKTKDGKIDVITLSNKRLVAILNKSDELVNKIFSSPLPANNNGRHTQEKYESLLNGFKTLMQKLRSFDDDSTDDEYIQWQLEYVDKWITLYLELFSWDGCGYYIHFLARGHVLEQLMRFRNIHKHSQQNWEGLMGVIKKFIATQTQHGGGKHHQENLSLAILRYIIRQAMYVLYPTDEELQQVLESLKPELNNELGLKKAKILTNFTFIERVLERLINGGAMFDNISLEEERVQNVNMNINLGNFVVPSVTENATE